jgi:hypothetical protein
MPVQFYTDHRAFFVSSIALTAFSGKKNPSYIHKLNEQLGRFFDRWQCDVIRVESVVYNCNGKCKCLHAQREILWWLSLPANGWRFTHMHTSQHSLFQSSCTCNCLQFGQWIRRWNTSVLSDGLKSVCRKITDFVSEAPYIPEHNIQDTRNPFYRFWVLKAMKVTFLCIVTPCSLLDRFQTCSFSRNPIPLPLIPLAWRYRQHYICIKLHSVVAQKTLYVISRVSNRTNYSQQQQQQNKYFPITHHVDWTTQLTSWSLSPR